MKRMLMAAALALAAAGLTEQKASAWCRFNLGGGVNLSYESSGGSFSFLGFQRTSAPYQGAEAAYPAPACSAPGYPAAGYPAAPAAPAPAAPAVPAPTPATGSTQQAGYYPQGGYAYPAYNPNQASPGYAPSYWYGN